MRLTELKERRAEILSTAARYGAFNVRVFGSVARGDSCAASDVDFLVELKPGRSLLDHVGLWQDLEELLGCKVDLVEPEGLHWYIKDRVLSEAIPL
jgi:predicted nucleotidyltransferase